MSDDTTIVQHLRAGQDQRVRITEAVAAFRRLTPEDYGYFLATIEGDMGGGDVGSGPSPLLLAGPPAEAIKRGKTAKAEPGKRGGGGTSSPTIVPGSLREAILTLLADGQPRSTVQIRETLQASRSVKAGTLNSEMFALRKSGLVHSDGQGRARQHTVVPKAAAAARSAAGSGPRSAKPRVAKKKSDGDDDDPPVDKRRGSPSAEQLYSDEIRNHELLDRTEELALAKRLEKVEIELWQQLLTGPLADRAIELLRAQDPPIMVTNPKKVRIADIDRVIVVRVIAEGRDRAKDDSTVAAQMPALRALAAEGERIRQRFTSCNLRLVPTIIRRYGYHVGTTLSMGDMIQEGNCGLIHAVPRFDHRRGLRFSTFATWWIRHHLVRARQNVGSEIRVPSHVYELANKARRAKEVLRQDLGRDPTLTELAQALKVPRKSLQRLETAWLKQREAIPSFDSTGEEGLVPSYLASTAPIADEVLGQLQEDKKIAAAVARLRPLHADILRRRYGLDGAEPETLKEIGVSMKLSRERIRQIEQRALALLRQGLAEGEGT